MHVAAAGIREDHLHPVKIPPAPDGHQTDCENEEEDKHLHKGYQAKVLEYNRPGKQDHYLHIKNKEYQRDDVKADIKLNPGASFNLFTAFISRVFQGASLRRCDESLKEERRNYNNYGKERKNRNWSKIAIQAVFPLGYKVAKLPYC